MNSSIVLLNIANLDAVCLVAHASFSKKWSRQDFAYFLANQSGYCIGVESEGKIQAFLLGMLVQRELDIVSIASHPLCRRQGNALRLIEYAKSDSTIQTISLEVDVGNTAAVDLYLKTGFEKKGIRKDYYYGKIDAYRMLWSRA